MTADTPAGPTALAAEPTDSPSPSLPGGAPAPDPRLAAVRRSLGWAAGGSERLRAATYLGRGCARLVVQVLDSTEPSSDLRARLEGLQRGLLQLDEALPELRDEQLTLVLAEIDPLVPPSIAGAILPVGPPLGRLIDPQPSPQRAESLAEPSADAAEEAPTEAVSSEPAPSGRRRRRNRERSRDRSRGDSKRTEREASPAEAAAEVATGAATEATPVEPPAPQAPPEPAVDALPRLPFGHPQGTGAPVASLGEVDPTLIAALSDQGIDTLADLLLLAPARHERPARASFSPLSSGPVLLRGQVLRRRVLLNPGSRRLELELTLKDGQELRCRWISGTPRGWAGWSRGQDIALVGELLEGDEGVVLYEAEPVGLDGRGSGLLPIYDLEDIEDQPLRELVAQTLGLTVGRLDDWMPVGIREENRLLPLDEALRDAHFPANTEGRGRVRMAFEELLLIQLGIGWRAGRGVGERGIAHKIVHQGVAQLESQHGITLRDGQEQAFAEIRRDLLRPRPMTRLLQGDVGAGKGLVALVSAIVVAEGGSQVAMVAPDSLAAERRYLHAESLLRSVGIVPLLVGDAVDHAQADAIRRGEAHVIFGAQNLLSEELEWKRLGLVVVEERSPYGTVQASALGRPAGGPRPDMLVVTRAPIPTSLVFTVFGDFDVSVVPVEERLRLTSLVHEASARSEAYAHARAAVEKGHQVFVVFPVRGGRDLLGREDALRMAKALQTEAFAGARIGVYSTEMGREERSRVFDDFQHRRIDVLVCTTYIEDAPAVSNASTMVVEYADLHTLVRLHRLRGHVAQGWTGGVCHFVLSDQPTEEGRRVVETVSSERDGFRLVELDLQIRGYEALLGDRADEMPDLRWADPPRDRELLLRARAEAFRLLQEDPGLRKMRELSDAVQLRWGDWLDRTLPNPARKGQPPQEGRGGRRRRRRRRRR